MSQTDLTLRWGIADITRKSCDFMSALLNSGKKHKIIAIAVQQVERAQSSAIKYQIQKIYNNYATLASDTNINIVFIGTSNSQCFDIAKLMLTHGKHVLCESPMTLNWGDTSKLIDYAQSKQLFLMEVVACRYFPTYDFIRGALAFRTIGDVDNVDILDIHEFPINEMTNDMMLDSVFHCLQFVCLVYNDEMPTITVNRGTENDNIKSVMIRLSYERNRIANILAINDRVPEGLDPSEARIFGTRGIIRVPWFSCPQSIEISNRSEPINLSILPESNIDSNFFGFSYVYEIAEVYTHIQHGCIESQKMTHDTSLLLAKLRDNICEKLNIWYS